MLPKPGLYLRIRLIFLDNQKLNRVRKLEQHSYFNPLLTSKCDVYDKKLR